MSLTKKALVLGVLFFALGALATTTAFLSYTTPASADSCNKIIALCHGCAPGSQGDIKSEGKCFNN